jgi:hypothetical protein
MTVAVKRKPRARGPLVLDGPEHGRPIQLVERVSCVNEQKSPLLLFLMLPPELIDGVDAAFDAGLEASTELIDAASLFGLLARSEEGGLGGKPPPGLTNSDRAYAWALVQCYG